MSRFITCLKTCIFFIGLCREGQCDPIETKLHSHILSNYSVFERPVEDHRLPVVVYVKFALQQLVDVDERNQILTTSAWLDLKWNNYLWRWNPKDYQFINKTRIPFDNIWKPDILLYNSADDKFDSTTHTSIVVDHHGNCLHMPPAIFKSTCKIDVSNFPFDEQSCTLKFGVWSYNGQQQKNIGQEFKAASICEAPCVLGRMRLPFVTNTSWSPLNKVDLQLQPGGGTDITEYTESGEWRLLKVVAQRNSHKYRCCPEKFVDVTVKIVIRRRTMFYIVNLILPCILNSILTLLTFFLPAEAAEKITLAITVLLAQIVFMLLIMETMPPTSDAIPIISKYFACSLITVCVSVAGTVLVLSFYYTCPEIDGKLSPTLKKFFLETAPKLLHMNPYCPAAFKEANATYINGKSRTSSTGSKILVHQEDSEGVRNSISSNNKHIEVVLGSYPSDESTACPRKKTVECLTRLVNGLVIPKISNTPNITSRPPPHQPFPSIIDSNRSESIEEKENDKKDSYFTIDSDSPITKQNGKQDIKRKCTCKPQPTHRYSGTDLRSDIINLREISESLKKITTRQREEKIHNEVLREWQFASRVLDKMLLWFFSLFVIITTLSTLFAVPNIADAFNMND